MLLRTSAVAALVAVGLGVASLVVTLALMSGYRSVLRQGILAAGGHLVAMVPSGLSAAGARDAEARVAALPGVSGAGQVVYLPGLLVRPGGGEAQAATVKAPQRLPPFVRLAATAGPGPVPVAVGSGLARLLAVEKGAVLTLEVVTGGSLPRALPVVVDQVFHTGFAELDDSWLVTPLPALAARVPGLETNSIEVWLDDPDRADAMATPVQEAVGDGALVTTWEENNRNLFAALRWQKISLGVVLSLVLGVGAFEVASALVVLVTEKRRELGVLLALGGRPRLLRRTLVLAGGGLGGAGVVAGLLLGIGVVAVLGAAGIPHFPPDIASIYMVDRIPLRLEASDLLTVAALGLVEVVLAALIPARRAASRDPVEVLRWV